MESIEGKYSKWEIWQDFIIMMAVSIANTFPGPHRAQREKLYQDHAAKYQVKELDVFAQMAAEVVSALEHNPEQGCAWRTLHATGAIKRVERPILHAIQRLSNDGDDDLRAFT